MFILLGEPDCSCYPDCKAVEYKMDFKTKSVEVSLAVGFHLIQKSRKNCCLVKIF